MQRFSIWLTEDEACKYANRSRLTLRDWRTRGQVVARRRKGVWEFDQESLRRRREFLHWREQDRLKIRPERAEAFQWLSECVRYKIPFPTDKGLATIAGCSHSQAREWKKQWLGRCRADTWDRSDAEIAARVNTTIRAVEQAREDWRKRQQSKFKPMAKSIFG